jgi:hypothetical protein
MSAASREQDIKIIWWFSDKAMMVLDWLAEIKVSHEWSGDRADSAGD